MLLRPETFATAPFVDATPWRRDPPRLLELARELGYLYLRDFLPAGHVAAVRAFARSFCEQHGWLHPDPEGSPHFAAVPGAQLAGRGWDDPRFVALQRELRLLPAFQDLAQDPDLLAILEWVVGEPVWLATANYCWLKFPGSPEQTTLPHQDLFYLPDTPRLWTAWAPLTDTPMDLGPLGVVPGSQRQGLWPHVDAMTGISVAPEVIWHTGPVRSGDVVLFDALAVHCAWSNVSPTMARASLDIRYEPRPSEGGTPLRPLA